MAPSRRLTPPRDSTWLPPLVASIAVVVSYLLLPDAAQRPLRAAVDLAGAVGVVLAVRTRRPAYAAPWWLLAAALAFATLGDTLSLRYDPAPGQPVPFPSLADAAHVVVAPLVAVALMLLARRRMPGRVTGKAVDAAIVSTGAGLLGSVYLMTPHVMRHVGFGPLAQAVAATPPSLDVFLLVLTALLLRAAPNPSLSILRAAFAVLLATDAAHLVASMEEVYRVGSPVDVGWLVTAVLFAAAAWHPTMADAADAVPDRGRDSIGKPRVVVLGLASLTFPAVFVSAALRFDSVAQIASVAAASTVLIGLVLARLYLVAGEAARLRERQDLTDQQTQFATMAAHELRTPLTTLRGSLTTLERARDAGLPAVHQEELVAMALRQTDRLERVCRDLDVVVRSTSGGHDVVRERVDVADVVRDVVLAAGAGPRAEVAVPDALVADADAGRLRQVLDNLVRNALQHAPGSAVRIAAEEVGGTVVVEVADDGPGLPPTVEREAFQRFRLRGHDATGGFGIGLWIVFELVTAMNGEVAYDGSRGGALFRVTLPRAAGRLAFHA